MLSSYDLPVSNQQVRLQALLRLKALQFGFETPPLSGGYG